MDCRHLSFIVFSFVLPVVGKSRKDSRKPENRTQHGKLTSKNYTEGLPKSSVLGRLVPTSLRNDLIVASEPMTFRKHMHGVGRYRAGDSALQGSHNLPMVHAFPTGQSVGGQQISSLVSEGLKSPDQIPAPAAERSGFFRGGSIEGVTTTWTFPAKWETSQELLNKAM